MSTAPLSIHRAGSEHYLARLASAAAGTDPGADPWGDLETAMRDLARRSE
jgi:hypothetical protein